MRIVRIFLPFTAKHYISTKRMHNAKRGKKDKKKVALRGDPSVANNA